MKLETPDSVRYHIVFFRGRDRIHYKTFEFKKSQFQGLLQMEKELDKLVVTELEKLKLKIKEKKYKEWVTE